MGDKEYVGKKSIVSESGRWICSKLNCQKRVYVFLCQKDFRLFLLILFTHLYFAHFLCFVVISKQGIFIKRKIKKKQKKKKNSKKHRKKKQKKDRISYLF